MRTPSKTLWALLPTLALLSGTYLGLLLVEPEAEAAVICSLWATNYRGEFADQNVTDNGDGSVTIVFRDVVDYQCIGGRGLGCSMYLQMFIDLVPDNPWPGDELINFYKKCRTIDIGCGQSGRELVMWGANLPAPPPGTHYVGFLQFGRGPCPDTPSDTKQ